MKFGENVKIAMTGVLKRRGDPLRDNLSDLPKRKVLRQELSSIAARVCEKS